ncbi:membrane protein [Stenotrophomonas ginsengisoli]|uniref:Probable queuosine precursor transporter n=1 Tax=Stenotrophomonas ginsengisoli TaxID=336566 RepID=A0A0R0DKC6_9GAMM|nr:VUT family protein [Stenotrophomonas ginsengisoli]KRG78746.1 membrane protein [Stenotrophomonas ginsengisoli]
MSLRDALLFAPLRQRDLLLAVLAMGVVVLGSNILVMYPINDWLTWGAFSYPVAFLVSNLVNRRFGPEAARKVAWAGFALAVLASIWLASPRIAIGSCLAFIASQLLDIGVFDRLRHGRWWRAPLVASVCSASLDTAIFWSVSFAGEPLPWVSWALGDLAVKLAIAVGLLLPFRIALWKLAVPGNPSGR